MSVIGLDNRIVKLAKYNKQWVSLFEREKKLIESSLKNVEVVDVQHVGSTSIPGVVAKPIIDIAVGLKRFADAKKCIKPLRKAGYEYRVQPSGRWRYLFVKGPPTCRTVHLYVERWGGRDWRDLVLFRDYLRNNPNVCKDYNQLKKALAQNYSNQRKSYLAGKDEFIKKIIRLAEENL